MHRYVRRYPFSQIQPKRCPDVEIRQVLYILPPAKMRPNPRPGVRVVVLSIEPLLTLIPIRRQRADPKSAFPG